MAEKRRFFDVWIVDSNTVYREVPFTVVCDWIQQGRLLAEDMVRNSGTASWQRLDSMVALVPYLPRPEPFRADDQAEALEAVHVDFEWKPPKGEDDGDVDMIPLIDVSLVLLVFFMMVGGSAGLAIAVDTPKIADAPIGDTSGIWVNMNVKPNPDKALEPIYEFSLGSEAKASPDAADRGIRDTKELLIRLTLMLEKKTEKVDVTINAHKNLEDGLVMEVTKALGQDPLRKKVKNKYIGVGNEERR